MFNPIHCVGSVKHVKHNLIEILTDFSVILRFVHGLKYVFFLNWHS